VSITEIKQKIFDKKELDQAIELMMNNGSGINLYYEMNGLMHEVSKEAGFYILAKLIADQSKTIQSEEQRYDNAITE
jgi:hypothetical protein